MPSRRRLATPTSVNRTSTRTRALALAVAVFFLCVSLTAEAKKKKPAKKHKTPAASTKAKGSSKEALPADEPESDEASSDSKSSSKKSADTGAGDDEKEAKADKPSPPAEADADAEGSKGASKVVRKAPAKEAESEGEGGAPFAMRFGVGGKALFRTLSWTETSALAPYSLSPGPETGVWLEAYPAAFATNGFAANIGVFGNFNYGFGASSKTPSGQMLTTKYQDFLAGLKVRVPLGNVQPYVAGAFGQQRFHLDPAPTDGSRPNFNYTVIHAGGGARVQFTPSIDGDLGAGFLIVRNLGTGEGEVASSMYYPAATAVGFDAMLSVGIRLASLVGVRFGADFRQLGVSLHWTSTDTGAKAGGAVDRYIGAWAGVEVVFDGLGGGSGESGSAPAPKAAPKAKVGSKAEPEEGEPSGDSSGKEEKASDIE